MASYHFEKEGSYISYETVEKAWWYSPSCAKFPKRKFFQNFEFDPNRRTASAEISWEDNPVFDNQVLWRYKWIFSEDFTRIEKGFCRQFYKNDVGEVCLKGTIYFSTQLHYSIYESLEAKKMMKVLTNLTDLGLQYQINNDLPKNTVW